MRTVYAVSAAALMLAVPLAFAGCSTTTTTTTVSSTQQSSTSSKPAAKTWADERVDTEDDAAVMSLTFAEIEDMEPLDAHEPATATKYPEGIWDKDAHTITPSDEADVWKVFAYEISQEDGKLIKTTMNANDEGYVRCAWKAERDGDIMRIRKVVCRWDRETGSERCWSEKMGMIRTADDTGNGGGGDSPEADA